ncbi:transcriptional regulator, MarR family [Tepidicaulis marinus]|uniref:Transcriptional regulator, MarR family n=1 Tax=Tepidicaulis marinus TaxID=1333998 RepID=A0A081B870_9HYPH|nr:MarR family winged helix-turn-helix transcriptional regulator [Tepidicaulis marinus]GAK44238.1 transcriptional regulator, MarR family [Tepidicaulis marinus]
MTGKDKPSKPEPSHKDAAPAGLPGDPRAFAVMTEISIIAHLADNLFARVLPDGLTVAQFAVLNHLLRLKKEETIGELASAHQVSQPTMSSTVRKLEDKKLVRLVPDAGDRRIKRVAVTRAGEAMRGEAVARMRPLAGELLGQIGEEDWARIHPVLTRLRILLDKAR